MSGPIVEILSQGNELMEGQLTDTNAAWLAQELSALGFRVARTHGVGDSVTDLESLLNEIQSRADLCLSTGGLGPTCDDLTAEAVASAFGRPLRLDSLALDQIKAWFEGVGRTMPVSNQRQAMLPQGAERLDNLWGTAPGFAVQQGRCRFYFLPGVPREMRALFEHHLRKELSHRWPLQPPSSNWVFETLGLGESQLAERMESLSLPPGTRVGFRTRGAENEVKIQFPKTLGETEERALIREIAQQLGEALYTIHPGALGSLSLKDLVTSELKRQGLKVFCRESLACGGLGLALADLPLFQGSEIHPAPSAPLPIENAEVLHHELSAQAEEILHRRHVDVSLVERWCPLGEPDETGRLSVLYWSLAATPSHQALSHRTLRGTPGQLRKTAICWGMNSLRSALKLNTIEF